VAELVRVRDDDRGAEISRQLYRRRRPVVHPDETPRPECHRVAGEVWVRVVVGQLEAGHQQQPVRRQCASPLALDLCAVLVEPVFVDARSSVQGRPRVVRAQHVVGDAENVEAGSAVEVDQLRHRQLAVAPRRVSVELTEESRASRTHLDRSLRTGLWRKRTRR